VRTRNIFLIVSLLAGLSAAAAATAATLPAHAAKHLVVKHTVKHVRPRHKTVVIRVAPADEYFGRLKMSILGIRNQLRDLDMKLQYSPEKSEDVIGSAAMVEDAIHDWEHKYPRDPWLAKDVYQLTVLYSHINTDHGRHVAAHAMHWLLGRYGKTAYAAQAKTQLGAALK
jgi:hypothetical protein